MCAFIGYTLSHLFFIKFSRELTKLSILFQFPRIFFFSKNNKGTHWQNPFIYTNCVFVTNEFFTVLSNFYLLSSRGKKSFGVGGVYCATVYLTGQIKQKKGMLYLHCAVCFKTNKTTGATGFSKLIRTRESL